MSIDGGANAIRGFNYQKAVISLIAVLNYRKDDFEIFLENQEDAEVLFRDTHTFIQIKGGDLSISKLKAADSKTKKSILGKNLSKKYSERSRYKIVTPDSFAKKDKNDLDEVDEVDENLIFDKIYKYSNSQKEDIALSLIAEGFIEEDLRQKLSKSYLYFSPFKNDLDIATSFIKGKMSDNNINLDNGKGDIALNELFNQIDDRSEIPPCNDNSYNQKKRLTASELKRIFLTTERDNFQDQIWKDVKLNTRFTLLEQGKIEKERLRILSTHKALKRKMIESIGIFTTDTDTIVLVESLYNKVVNLGEKCVLYAILIDIIAERMQEELSCL
jgi:hypothetical protein